MKDIFRRLGEKVNGWMLGRYGMDELSRAMLYTAVFLSLASLIFGIALVNSFALVLMIWALFRCYSKNIYKRREERQWWLNTSGSVKAWFSLQKRKWHDRREYKYFRCKKCKTVMRVPRGKGKVKINCRKCHSEIDGKT